MKPRGGFAAGHWEPIIVILLESLFDEGQNLSKRFADLTQAETVAMAKVAPWRTQSA